MQAVFLDSSIQLVLIILGDGTKSQVFAKGGERNQINLAIHIVRLASLEWPDHLFDPSERCSCQARSGVFFFSMLMWRVSSTSPPRQPRASLDKNSQSSSFFVCRLTMWISFRFCFCAFCPCLLLSSLVLMEPAQILMHKVTNLDDSVDRNRGAPRQRPRGRVRGRRRRRRRGRKISSKLYTCHGIDLALTAHTRPGTNSLGTKCTVLKMAYRALYDSA